MKIKRQDITWAPHIPLIGGFPLGAEKSLGKPPEEIISLDGFWTNDRQYVNYMNEVKKNDIKYTTLDPEDFSFKKKINMIISTCPCAALSSLNTGKNKNVRGCQALQNGYIYVTTEQAIKCYDADVIVGENAPGLYTAKGLNVANKIHGIARENGYSMTLFKTNTIFHGLPQNRIRTFYILWKNDKAPAMNWVREDYTEFKDYLAQVTRDMPDQNTIINRRIGQSESYYNFIKHKTGKNPRDILITDGRVTAMKWIAVNDLFEEARDWFIETGDAKGADLASHAIYKHSIGKGVWDSSTHVFDKAMNAVIGRNLADTIHPTEDRSLTVREAFHMMGFPHDFELIGNKGAFNLIAQNVPVNTAATIIDEATKFLTGEMDEFTPYHYLRQDNIKQTTIGVE